MVKSRKVNIIFSGGGTGGSVAPLLALAQNLSKQRPEWNLVWIGTNHGLEKVMVKDTKLSYVGIYSGKWRRYFSLKNIIDWFRILIGFFQSFIYLAKVNPRLIMSAGGFVSVPLVWAGWLLRIPVIVHQQDVRPGLANKLMAPAAKKVTTTFKKSINDYGKKAVFIGNPVREEFDNAPSREQALKEFGLSPNLPVVTITGGGSGAKAINYLAKEAWPILQGKCQIIHIMGANSSLNILGSREYKVFKFVSAQQVAAAFSASDLVIARGGLAFITELSYLRKPAIFIPMPRTHQEDNTQIIQDNKAGLVLEEDKTTAKDLANEILRLLEDKSRSEKLAENLYNLIPQDSKEKLTEIIISYVEK